MAYGWAVPSRRLGGDIARRAVLWQHCEIRTLLEKARAIADDALAGDAPRPDDAVASAIGDLRTILDVHLTFEEKALIPALDGELGLAEGQLNQLMAEHRRQRSMVETLHREAKVLPYSATLAVKLGSLTSWFLSDMADEERWLMSEPIVRDPPPSPGPPRSLPGVR